MKKHKNKTYLTISVIVFMLVFGVGAVFASIPGALQVGGGIGVGDPNLRVEWSGIQGRTAGTLPGALGPVAGYAPATLPAHLTTDFARIVDFMPVLGTAPTGSQSENNRLEWAIGFIGAGSASITARAENVGVLDAEVLAPTFFSWDDTDPAVHSMFTVTQEIVAIDGSAVTGVNFPVIIEPGETVDIRITVAWDGVMGPFYDPLMPFGSSTNNNWVLDGWLTDLIIGNTGNAANYDWANNFFFNLVYQTP
ncbi:MAG: hypothetical protein FWE34_05875 [Defluviitaleaceae bacterium]|nr:hypothetical protein [Defluviitaleaceae bacterium]